MSLAITYRRAGDPAEILERIADAVRHVSQPGKVGTVVVKP